MVRKKILVAPLDWGLGHATRCIPVIRALLNAGNEVVIAADGRMEHLLREEFFGLKFIYLKGYRLTYSSVLPAWLKIILLLPKILFRMMAEHHQLKKIIADHHIDVVISDGRFGLWNKKICSVYITHQLMIKCPKGLKILEPLLHYLHKIVIKKFNHCWIPDYAGQKNLSGDLSHKYPLPENAQFVNPLSRFKFTGIENKTEYDLCAVISGPEPSRTEFEKIILSFLNNHPGKSILIEGKPGNKRDELTGNVRIVSHLNSKELEKIISVSRLVICRSGYSSIMDLAALKKNALLVPTPGQTEQEYLSEYLTSEKIYKSTSQSSISIEGLGSLVDYSVLNIGAEESFNAPLSEAINKIKVCG